MQERGGRIGHAGFVVGQKRLHAGKLSGNACRPLRFKGQFGIGKVRNHIEHSHAFDRVDFGDDGRRLLGRKAQAVHARIDLDVHFEALVRARFEHFDLTARVHDGLDADRFELRDLFDLKKTFEHQDTLFPARVPRPARFGHFDQRKTVGLGKARDGVFKPVPVGIGLDDGPQSAAVCGPAQPFKVVPHGFDIDGCADGSGHFLLVVARPVPRGARSLFVLFVRRTGRQKKNPTRIRPRQRTRRARAQGPFADLPRSGGSQW